MPADELAAEVALRRVGTSTPGALLARVLRGRGAPGRTFLYPRLGFAEVSGALAAAAAAAGARLACGAEVDRVAVEREERGNGRALRVSCRDGRAVRATTVFSTLPAATLCALVEPPAPAAVRTAARSLESRAMVLVYLVVDRARYTPYDAHYLPGPATPLTRLSEPKNYRDGPDPPDRTVLCAELPAWVGDELWSRDDADLARLATDTLLDLDLPAARPIGHAVERRPAVYPVLRVGGERRVAHGRAAPARPRCSGRDRQLRPPGPPRPRQHPPRPGHGVGGGRLPRRRGPLRHFALVGRAASASPRHVVED